MKRALSIALVLLGCRNPATSAPAAPPPVDPMQRLQADRMHRDLEFLADDALAGRFSLSPESIGAAAQYIAGQYRSAGLGQVGDDYLVQFELPAGSRDSDEHHVWLDVGNDSQDLPPERFVSLAPGTEPVVGAVAEGPSVKGKIALVRGVAASDLAKIVRTAVGGGATAVLVEGSGEAPEVGRAGDLDLGVPVLWLHPPVPKGIEQVAVSRRREEITAEAPNLLAVIPGSERPDEIVVLGAHYDHIGTRKSGVMCFPGEADPTDVICNGADDNASGSAMVLEIARAFAGYKPKRTVVFAHFAGEELGLHGSRALVHKPPSGFPFASGKFVAMLNLDMVGRLGEAGLSVGGIGSSPAWMPILNDVGFEDMTVILERAVTARSDHANFYRQKVPILFFFTGVHADYHRASDELDLINRPGMAKILRLVAGVLKRLADGAAIPFSEPRTAKEGEVIRLPGSDPSTLEPR